MKLPCSRQIKDKNPPTKEGLYQLIEWNGFGYSEYEVEVYELHNSTLCVWGEEIDFYTIDYIPYWNIEEWNGHIPVNLINGKWKFIQTID